MTRDVSVHNKTRSGHQSITLNGDRTYSNHQNPTEFYHGSYYNNSNHVYPHPAPLNNNYQSSSTMFSAPDGDGLGYAIQTPNHNHTQLKSNPGSSSKLRETIHSGQFMVSDFEPESEVLDEEYEAGMPVPCEEDDSGQGSYGASGGNAGGNRGSSESPGQRSRGQTVSVITMNQKFVSPEPRGHQESAVQIPRPLVPGGISTVEVQKPLIDGSLTKLFQCMSLAYR